MLKRWGLAAAAMLAALLFAGCDHGVERAAAAMTGGDPERGKAALRRYGCSSCHTIPGVRGSDGRVGPPLDGVASRVYIGGVLQNTPDNMVAWLRDPRHFAERTAMPNEGLSESEARDMAAYLYTLR